MSIQGLPVVSADQMCCAPLARGPMDWAQAVRLSRMFKALADPVRLRLLSLICASAEGEVCVCDLVTPFDLSQPTISHHLKVLRDAGLISSQRRGTWVYYSIRPGELERLATLFTPRTEPADPATR